MLDPKGIQPTMKKLEDARESGEMRFTSGRGGENRYAYYFAGQLIFTFGLTRGSRQKSKQFHCPRIAGHILQAFGRSAGAMPLT